MKTLNVSEFRSQCLTLIEHLPKGGVVITKRGKPVAKLVPIENEIDNSWMFGALKGKLEIKGDTMSTGLSWNAES
jgi:prevent-host-death family protein